MLRRHCSPPAEQGRPSPSPTPQGPCQPPWSGPSLAGGLQLPQQTCLHQHTPCLAQPGYTPSLHHTLQPAVPGVTHCSHTEARGCCCSAWDIEGPTGTWHPAHGLPCQSEDVSHTLASSCSQAGGKKQGVVQIPTWMLSPRQSCQHLCSAMAWAWPLSLDELCWYQGWNSLSQQRPNPCPCHRPGAGLFQAAAVSPRAERAETRDHRCPQ